MHPRRKFDEALKGLPPKKRSSGSRAREALDSINRLSAIEQKLKRSAPEERLQIRNLRSQPVVDEFRKWLDDILPGIMPKSLLGLAVNYAPNQWSKLVRILEDGRIEMGNNRAECSIKPFVISRKNSLFCDTPRGAPASAIIFGIIESAKENRMNPYSYLNYLFEKLPNLESREISVLDQLLPWNVNLP